MSSFKRRVWPGAMVIVCLLVALWTPAVTPDNDRAFAQSPGAPDLVVESMSWYPEAPVLGDTVTFTATIRNQGDSPAGPSRIAYYIDDTFPYSDDIDRIEADSAITNTLTWESQAGEHTIKAVIDCDDSVAEANEDNNEKTYAFSVLAADLIIESITWSPENPSIGNTVTFTIMVKNQGNKNAGCSHIDFLIDDNSRGHRETPRITPGGNFTETYSWIAMSGSHVVRAVADPLNKVTESDEANNEEAQTYATAAPDLIISSITWTPTDRSETSNVIFTVTIKNQGSGTADNSRLDFYIDDACQASVYVNRLGPGATTTRTYSWVVGVDAHTLKAVADADDSVAEEDETNNSRSVDLPALAPDLIIQSISWSPTPPLIAHKVTFTITIKNQGVKQADYAGLYYRIDDAYEFHHQLAIIPAGSTEAVSFPWSTRQTSITIWAVVDEDNYINEINESNNTKTANVTFVVLSPTTDLSIQSIACTPVSPSIGDTVSITSTIKNNGPEQANPSHVAYYIDDILLDSVYLNKVAAGATVTNNVAWPAAGGTHTIRAVIDCNDSVFETNESNNEMTVTLTVPAPDLVIQSLTWTPLVPATGDEITFTLAIENQGLLEAGSSYVSYYVDGTYRGNHYVEDIGPGGTVIRTFTWKAQAESHTFKAIIDKVNAVTEGDESNNERAVVLPAPDLTIGGITWSPTGPSENSTVTFVIAIKNIGLSTADSPYLACYIDDILQTNLRINSIAAGATAAGTFTWTAQSGEHVFKVIADGADSITESDESNNEKAINLFDSGAPEEPVTATESATEVEPAATTVPNEPNEPEAGDTATTEIAETPPTENTTEEEDIAANIADDSSAGWKDILMNRWLIIGVGGVGAAAIVVLLLLRRRAKKA